MINLSDLADTIARKERELRELYRERARLHGYVEAPQIEIVALRGKVDGQAVAIDVSEVSEVVRMAELAALPDAPPALMGVLAIGSLRAPIFDLFARGVVRRNPKPEDFIVLMHTRAGLCGLVMDSIDGIAQVSGSSVPLASRDAACGVHVVGVIAVGGESVFLLSAAAVPVESIPRGDSR